MEKDKGRQKNPQPLTTPQQVSGKNIKSVLGSISLVLISGLLAYNLYFPSIPDVLLEEERQRYEENTRNIANYKIDLVKAHEIEGALDTMPIDEKSKKKLRSKLSSQKHQSSSNGTLRSVQKKAPEKLKLAWIELWDYASQDGDVIQLSSGGYSAEVSLLNTISRIAIPIDQTSSVNLTGIADGGGGITLGTLNNGTELRLILRPMDSITLPVVY